MARDAPSSAAAWSADATFPGGNGLIVFSRHKSPASYRNGDWPISTPSIRAAHRRGGSCRAAAQAAWSPDGRRLAVVDCCSDKPAKVLQGAPTVIEPSILSPAWAPDGSRLVGFGCVYGDCGVVIADLDGGATSLLFETGDYSGDMGAEEPEWAPRGALIALTTWGNLNPEDRRIGSTTSRLDVFALDPLSTAPTPHGRLTGHGSHSIPPTRTRRRHCPDRP